jgi:hypothetical protein
MTAPNLRDPSSVTGKTLAYYSSTNVGSTAVATVLSNPAASNNVLKINCIRVYADPGKAGTIYLDAVGSSSSNKYVVKDLQPDASTVIVVGRDDFLYLEEGYSLLFSGSAGFTIMVTYEIIAA